MDRVVWWATIHGVSRVQHGLATKQQPQPQQQQKKTAVKTQTLII